MATREERLAAYRRSQNPLGPIAERLHVLKGETGEKGDKGDIGPRGFSGANGSQGPRGATGPQGKEGKQGIDGKHGRDGKDGVDGKDGLSPSIENIIKELRKLPVAYKDIKDAPDLTDLPKLIHFLKAGGFRGGGDTVAAGANVTISEVNGVKTINASGGTGGLTLLPATGAVNGTNAVFTFTAAPTYIVSDGVWYQAKDNNGITNWSGTTTVTMTIPPNSAIWGF
jgi:hypothetical protein